MGLRGAKPLTDDAAEMTWLTRVRKGAERMGNVQVYCAADRHGVHVRKSINDKAPRRLPPGAVHIGQFALPVDREALLSSIRSAMKQVGK